MADITGKIRLLRGTIASFASGAFNGAIRIITDSQNGVTLSIFSGSAWWQMARQDASGKALTQGLKVNAITVVDGARNASFVTLKNEAITPNVLPRATPTGEADSCFSDNGATAACSLPLALESAFGAFGVTPPTTRPTVDSACADLTTCIALTNQLRAHLIACGLVQ